MPARFNAYPPDQAALVRVLEDDVSYRIGRSADCELCVDHFSVSRFHAELSSDGQAWSLRDTGSKNGVRVDGHIARSATLSKSSWFAVGDVYCRLEMIDADAAAMFKAQSETRRATSRWLSQRFSPSFGIGTLIPQTLDTVLELSGLERGFVLYGPVGEPMRVRASRGLINRDIAEAGFAGSAAAVEQAMSSGRSVVCCDTNDSPWLGARPSVRLGGIRALVCVPLRVAEGSIGAIYLDSRKPGPPVTELDLELIESVAQHAAAAMAARRLQGEVDQLMQAAADQGMHAPRWDELRPGAKGPDA